MNDADSFVRIDWHDGLPWVAVQNNWREHLSPMALAARVVAEHRKVVTPKGLRRRPAAPTGNLSYEDRKEFRALRREYVMATTERRLAGNNIIPAKTTRVTGIEARWRGGALSVIGFDPEWLERSTAQSLSEALTELLSNPPESPPDESSAVEAAIRKLETFGAKHE